MGPCGAITAQESRISSESRFSQASEGVARLALAQVWPPWPKPHAYPPRKRHVLTIREASMASIGASFRRRSASVSRPCRALTPKPRAEAAPITTYWSSASQRWARTDVGIRYGSPSKMVVERCGEESQPCRAISPRFRPPFVLVDSPAAQPLHTRVHRAGGAMHTRREHPNGRFRPVINVSNLGLS